MVMKRLCQADLAEAWLWRISLIDAFRVFLRKMLGTRQGPDFSVSRNPILSDFRDPMIIFYDSKDPNRARLKKNLDAFLT